MSTGGPSDSVNPVSEWPNAYGSVYTDCLDEVLLRNIVEDAPAVASCPNFWTPKDGITATGDACTACEAAIRMLYQSVMRHRLPEDWAGAEWWVQVYETGKGLAFHFDKDEHLFKEERRMVHPLLSSILYLTGTTFPKRLGPTVIVDQRFDNSKMRAWPEDPQRCAVVYPRRGALAVFDGGLGHGVLGSASPDLRATLLINWWPHQPQEVQAITAEDAARHSLGIRHWPDSRSDTACSPASSASAAASAASAASALPMQQLSLRSSQPRASGAASRAAQEATESALPSRADPNGSWSAGTAGESSAGKEQNGEKGGSERGQPVAGSGTGCEKGSIVAAAGRPCAQPLPVLKLPPANGASGVISVDDLLYSNGLSLVGSGAVSSVAIDHPGWALYPLGDEAQEGAEDGEAPMQTAAVFVPLHMMPSESSSGSDSEGE